MKMRLIRCIIAFLSLSCCISAAGQTINFTSELLEPVNVQMSLEKNAKKNTVRVVKDSAVREFDEATFVKIKRLEFQNGTIEVSVLSKLLPNAPEFARGFIGIAFRINDDNSKFECIYVRPANARADDQIRRNHSIQYFAYPDFKFQRLRKESPEKYESYSDMALNEWIKLKVVVVGVSVKLYLNDNKEPSLIVNDLKLGSEQKGGIGLFVDVGTEGYFTELKVSTNIK